MFRNPVRAAKLLSSIVGLKSLDQIELTLTTHASVSHLKMPGLSKQYLQIKSKYPDFIVLFQVGDFYEIYSDDAVKVAEKTSLRISRNPNVNRLMAGFPVRSLDSWLTTLVQQGFQLAICPQQPSKTPTNSRLIHREVVRLVTPGTLLEPQKPDANYLMSIAQGPDSSLGLGWLDLSTGEFHLGVSSLENLEEDLSRVSPAEVLMAKDHLEDSKVTHNPKTGMTSKRSPLEKVKDFHLTLVPSEWFNTEASTQTDSFAPELFSSMISSQFSSLEKAAGAALLKFVSYTQRHVAPLVSHPSKFSHGTHMAIDSNTRRALELTKPLMGTDKKATLFGVMNNTTTASGQRLLYSRLCAPSTELDVIQLRLNAVEFFSINRPLAEELRKNLKICPDIERKMQRVATGVANLSDLRAIHGAIVIYKNIVSLVHNSYFDANLRVIDHLFMADFDQLDGLYNELDTAVGQIVSENSMMEGYSNTADEIKDKLDENTREVEELRDLYRETLNIPRLVINGHKSFIRVVEIPITKKELLTENQNFVFLEATSSKVRYSTLKLQELNARLKALQEEHERVQRALSEDLCNQVTSHAEHLKRLAISMAELDVTTSLALLALQRGYVKPNVKNHKEFQVKGGRHPVVDMLQPNSFVCNDCELGERNVWIVTGPNMGGKSTFLRQNALLAILAQAGSFVPAQSAEIGIVDRVFARIGASDNLVQYQSTFMSEMLETAFILANATEKSLVVVDEIGRGTSMLDGLSIAWSVIEHIHSAINCRTLASTHYYQLAKLADILPRVDCYHVTAKKDRDGISFTFKVIHGCDHKSFGIDVAKLAGVPALVETRAREILNNLEQNDSIYEDTLEVNEIEKRKEKHSVGNSSDTEVSEGVVMPRTCTRDSQVETELTKAILLLNPESLTPRKALEIIYDLQAKARNKNL